MLQLTYKLSTYPFIQIETVWPKFVQHHLPRCLFSLLGKHLRNVWEMYEAEKWEYLWIYHMLEAKSEFE